jgi:hypothetical protein
MLLDVEREGRAVTSGEREAVGVLVDIVKRVAELGGETLKTGEDRGGVVRQDRAGIHDVQLV